MKANTGKVAEMIPFFVEFPSRWKEPIWVPVSGRVKKETKSQELTSSDDLCRD